jgi:plasmid stability protein
VAKSVHIRDVDPDVLRRIQRLARLHHRSMQGELRAILEEVARRAPDSDDYDPDGLITVDVGGDTTWRRADTYTDDAR